MYQRPLCHCVDSLLRELQSLAATRLRLSARYELAGPPRDHLVCSSLHRRYLPRLQFTFGCKLQLAMQGDAVNMPAATRAIGSGSTRRPRLQKVGRRQQRLQSLFCEHQWHRLVRCAVVVYTCCGLSTMTTHSCPLPPSCCPPLRQQFKWTPS